MAKKIMTVTGPISPEQLGKTSMHEHVLMNGMVMQHSKTWLDKIPLAPDTPLQMDNIGLISHNGMMTYDAVDMRDEELMIAEVGDFKAAGADSMLEVSAVGIRADVAGVKRIAVKNDVQVVTCTGFYISQSWPEQFKGMSVKQLREFMLGEVKNGIEDTGVYPGVVKIGMDAYSPDEQNALRAAAQVAKETGLSLTIHPSDRVGADAITNVEAVIKEGLDPSRVVIAHVGSSIVEHSLKTLITDPSSWKFDITHVQRLVDMGVTVCTEFLGQNVADELGSATIGTTDHQRMALIYELVKRGHADQIVLGTDTCAKMLTRRYGGEGYLRLWNFVIPLMRKILGMSEYCIDQIFVENPKRILAYD
ncbi:hypothetical protein LJC27_05815 [Christensenellaceae bacterium OttesenSCG-928-M15]|nr:hypothetical protein [Christensenellaceae bacterium OttesenSCG-928-M15]